MQILKHERKLFHNLSFNHMYRLFDKTKTIACFRKCKCSIELQYIYVIWIFKLIQMHVFIAVKKVEKRKAMFYWHFY